jgi:tRNA(Ile)-lysidine synthase
LSIPLHINVCSIEPSGRGVEADARRERYRAFESVLAKGDILFTAHHADDMVETVLLRLLRGAGPRGLSGIPQERACGVGRIFRPLLNTTSDTLRSVVEAAGLEHVIDPSNLETEQDRNYLRQVVLLAGISADHSACRWFAGHGAAAAEPTAAASNRDSDG